MRRTRQVEPSHLGLSDLIGEATASLAAGPGRAMLTALGTVLGLGAFVAVLGITATASGQISTRFTALTATEVTVEDVGVSDGGGDPALTGLSFPPDADERVVALPGVNAAGVWWPIRPGRDLSVSTTFLPERDEAIATQVAAASPGLLKALRPTIAAGRLYDAGHEARADHVVVVGAAVARRIGLADVALQPAIFIDNVPFTVIGVIGDVERQADVLFSVLVPRQTAVSLWGGPASGGARAAMVIDTSLGAAQVVSSQVALALRPDAPDAFKVTAPPDPQALREAVSTDLDVVFLALASVSLVIGAVGIANTTMVSVLERVGEIGLRRALGARPRHIAAQFLTESAFLGIIGGVIGTSLGVITVVSVALVQRWTPILEPLAVLPAPLAGMLIGACAGAYPAMRAARIEPVEALRR
ncbi:ABC transporter permease [Catellatospora citrea]|uniref:ABC transporter permease n=1 Tax=Catellatospora citrea TaxID=53366 RepID=UPI00340E2A5E